MSKTLNNSRRILVVDDDSASLEIIHEALKWEGYSVRKLAAGEEALKCISEWDPELAILDVNMPGMNGIETLRDLRKRGRYVSVIFLSGNSSTDAVIEGLDAGADDYVAKPFNPQELLARVRTQLRIKDLNDELLLANERLKELVDTDDLTGLFNMRSLYQRLDVELSRARRYKRQVALVMMDMDHFKTVNDGHDHLFGSFVLAEVGGIVRQTVRNTDIAARYGGDEFLIVLTDISREGARAFCERLRKDIEKREFVSGKDQIQLTASIGFSITEPGQVVVDPRNLVRTADVALYVAKRTGRNCVRFQTYEDSESPHNRKPKAS